MKVFAKKLRPSMATFACVVLGTVGIIAILVERLVIQVTRQFRVLNGFETFVFGKWFCKQSHIPQVLAAKGLA